MIDIEGFIQGQLQAWPMAAGNFRALEGVRSRSIGGVRVQFNPARIVSTGAKVDAASIKKRACFLCAANRPAEQTGIEWGGYTILINPFPIFPRHLTIPAREHVAQSIEGRMADMCRLAQELEGYTVFYNGPKCGASAPDHMHFQAGNSDFLPESLPEGVASIDIEAATPEEAQTRFEAIYRCLPSEPGQEPMMNVLCRALPGGRLRVQVIPRKLHRPTFYGSEEGQMLISPASVDVAGVIITPRESDFESLDADKLRAMWRELCYDADELRAAMCAERGMADRLLKVGIMHSREIELELDGPYLCGGDRVSGAVSLDARNVKEPMLFTPLSAQCTAMAKNVTIGVNFHWQRQENQRYKGRILVQPCQGELALINILHVEDYLESVISSEMSATSQLELLKAHAVISRSWVLAQIERQGATGVMPPADEPQADGSLRRVVWYCGNDHDIYDVCADDHCQRYQGITRQTTGTAAEAVRATAGEVLVSGGELCDTRFSKCCGGAFESYEYCWEPSHKPYLIGKLDREGGELPDLTDEATATEWILSSPEAFCNTADKEVLSQVLNGYDQETADFYRWSVEAGADELGERILQKSGIDLGRILELKPLERGTSGRISLLRIEGEKGVLEVGKELEIRRLLSPTHLYSSAFVAEKTPVGFRLRGAGWGHGVGLCQIGAAMMAARGYGYRQILQHYYPGSEIKNI